MNIHSATRFEDFALKFTERLCRHPNGIAAFGAMVAVEKAALFETAFGSNLRPSGTEVKPN